MKILVTTPTGKIGSRIVRELLAPDFSVRVIARDPEQLANEIREQVEVICGSIDDATTLRRALDGVEALFWCVPAESPVETKVERHYERFACAAWLAIREARTPRVVTISAGGKGRAVQAGPISGLHAMEEILNESGAAIRHLRCGVFMENLLSQMPSILEEGFLSYPIPGHVPVPFVAAPDIADAALKYLVRRDLRGIEAIAIHGPEDLTYSQVAALIERTMERPVQYRQAPGQKYIETLVENGASVEYAHAQVAMFSELARGILRAEPRTPESTTRTTLAAWAESELLPFVGSSGLRVETAAGQFHSVNPWAHLNENNYLRLN
jgi:uncharacterized protein YbjT (DUF2867 family)